MTDDVGDKELLVLLDNFEQVVGAAPVVSALLANTPNVKVLVTSRESLRVDWERRFPVEPLPADAAVALFTERARAVAPGFEPVGAVAQICSRLDGLPLALELAAAGIALLEPAELLARLDRRLPLLESQSRDTPARQRTLRTTIEWSYELLTPEEQELFRRLAVFRGSCTVQAAEAVCGARLETLESLVIKSLLRRWPGGRLGMLDTIREFAVELLDAATDCDEVRRGHAEHFLAIAEEANLNAGTRRPGGQRLDLALVEQDNFRGAITWALRSGSIDLGFAIATALEQLWTLDDPHEGSRWFGRLFEQPGAQAPPNRACARTRSAHTGARSCSRASTRPRRRCGFGASSCSTSSVTNTGGRSCCTVSASSLCGVASSPRHGSSSPRAIRSTRATETCGAGRGR